MITLTSQSTSNGRVLTTSQEAKAKRVESVELATAPAILEPEEPCTFVRRLRYQKYTKEESCPQNQ